MTEVSLYNIDINQIYGRHLVAAKDLKIGEMILNETPAIIGAQINGELICFSCYKKLAQGIYICSLCNKALLCSKNCTGVGHTTGECNELKKRENLKPQFFLQNPHVVLIVRCLLMQKYNAELWRNIFDLESHLETRRDTFIWRSHQYNVENVLTEINFLSSADVKDELVQKICGILDVNSFELRPAQSEAHTINPSDCIRGLYLKAAMISHDCIGNTHLAISDDFTMTIRAANDIKKGDTIFFNYSNGLQGNVERAQHLIQGKYFQCSCGRCLDPTEHGTNLSAIKCKCSGGLINPNYSKEKSKIVWTCNKCMKVFNNNMIKTSINTCQELIEDSKDVCKTESTLQTLQNSLSSQHFLILELKQNLIGFYGENPSLQVIAKRITYCQDLLKVLLILEPALSRLQGITQYELHISQVDWADKKYQSKSLSTSEYIQLLAEAEVNLRAAIKCLLYEPKNSPEGRLAQKALTSLKVLKGSIEQVQKIQINEELIQGNVEARNKFHKQQKVKFGGDKKRRG